MTLRFYPDSSKKLISGGWDSVKLWDLRNNKISAELKGITVCGHAIDMSKDQNTLVTGGGVGADNLKVWDTRKLANPVVSIRWCEDKINPLINCVKLIQGHKMVLVGGSDEIPAKCFSTQTGEMWANFTEPERSCLSIDVRQDNKEMTLTDASGNCISYHLRFSRD